MANLKMGTIPLQGPIWTWMFPWLARGNDWKPSDLGMEVALQVRRMRLTHPLGWISPTSCYWSCYRSKGSNYRNKISTCRRW